MVRFKCGWFQRHVVQVLYQHLFPRSCCRWPVLKIAIPQLGARLVLLEILVSLGSSSFLTVALHNPVLISSHNDKSGTRRCSWLRHCATSRNVSGSIPDGVIGIFHRHNPSGRTMALGLTQPLTEMSTRNIFWGGKGGRCVGLTTLPPSCAYCLEIWEPQPPGTLGACPGL